MLERVWQLLVSLFAGGLFLGLIFAGTGQDHSASANTGQPAPVVPASLQRDIDPLQVEGEIMPAFWGFPIDELALYKYDAGAWSPIPFQVDEVDASGAYVTFEDGLMDANDELVFMGGDAGSSVLNNNWPDDAASKLHSRYVITATDPLNPADQGWVYLYRSPTLPHSNQSYISWDYGQQTLTASSYTLSFDSNFVGFANLELNGSGDVLDRQKIRVVNTFGVITEEAIQAPVDLTNIGPVRALGGGGGALLNFAFAFYGARMKIRLGVNMQDIGPIHFDSARLSLDMLNPATSEMAPATYYDSNLATGVPIDGMADNVPPTPPNHWYEVSGAVGSLVHIFDVNPGNGIRTNYYLDNSSIDPDDTGDQRSYGDAGILISAPSPDISIGYVTAAQTTYILPAAQGNVGQTYTDRAHNPLTAAAAAENYGSDVSTPTPGATPSTTATPAPSPTPTVTSTPTKTPTPTPTQTPPPSPSPTITPRPTEWKLYLPALWTN
ncbi:MAG: hypothetical protein H6650_02855 [Ardenticatenales bacterium]|nr:hypothetical protein [Ardenticatenales bacterium]